MKKSILLLALIATFSTNVFADDYQYLTFLKSDGSSLSVTAEGLKITFVDGNLVATQGGQTTTIALTDLNKMYFTSEATGIKLTDSEQLTIDNAEVYDIQGRRVNGQWSTVNGQLPRGIYIVKKDGKSTKVIVQ